jgi:hypothetical protein
MTAAVTGHPVGIPDAVRQLLSPAGLADEPVRFAATSPTSVDTGSWLRGRHVWVGVVGERLVIAAPGPTPLVRVLPLTTLAQATYNHVTGALAFPRPAAPGGEPLPTLRLDPLVARSLLGLAPSPPSPGTIDHA